LPLFMLPVALAALLAREALPQKHAGDVLLVDVQKLVVRHHAAGVPKVATAVRDSSP
jgi:hypothetical protein